MPLAPVVLRKKNTCWIGPPETPVGPLLLPIYMLDNKGYPCPENVLGVPHSTETDMLTLDTTATILMSSDMSESILPVFGGQLTANIT